jgi:hypothetical protein
LNGFVFALVLILALLLPGLVEACPACANRDDGSGFKTVYVMGSMILFPFGVAFAVSRVIKRVTHAERSDLGATR